MPRKNAKSKLSSAHRKVNTFDWGGYLDASGGEAVPALNFKHVSQNLNLSWFYRMVAVFQRQYCSF